jgi:hypothetical protein
MNMGEENKILIKARGGTPEQRAAVASIAKDMKDVDINFLNIDGVEGEMVLEVKTACGEAETLCSDLQVGGAALESIISKVKCPVAAPIITQSVVPITPMVTETPTPISAPAEKKEGAPDGVQAN